MKTIKPHEEKFFKDIVLNNILEEISNENPKIAQHSIRQKKHTKKSSSKQKIIKIIIVLCLITAPFVFFNLPQNTKEHEALPQKDKTLIHNIEENQKKEKLEMPTVKKSVKPKAKEVFLPEKNEREKAKASLLEQMKK